MQKIIISFLVLSFIVFFSCKKSDRDEDKTTSTSQDYAMVQSIALDLFKIVHQAALSSAGISANNLTTTTSIFGCDTLIVDTLSSPMSISIKFTNCSSNGAVRNGIINATFSSKYDVSGTNTILHFNNYSHNEMPVSGEITIFNNGLVNGKPMYGFTSNGFKIDTGKKNRNLFWNANQSFTQYLGETTADFTDDSFKIIGISNGRAFAGNTFTTNTDSLFYLGNCNWISTGIATVRPENLAIRKLDFGSTCDNKAVVTLFGQQYEIAFP
ncbi:MAG: hypothetical protein CVT95_06560 [Bacteroidetes bacterium HGW-Bacteroidetes-12]|nr:MAG: hypothetical protein CVT95_06560 [Bacteroidetes bacterium HGW-Bacteroidetes-12]